MNLQNFSSCWTPLLTKKHRDVLLTSIRRISNQMTQKYGSNSTYKGLERKRLCIWSLRSPEQSEAWWWEHHYFSLLLCMWYSIVLLNNNVVTNNIKSIHFINISIYTLLLFNTYINTNKECLNTSIPFQFICITLITMHIAPKQLHINSAYKIMAL